MKLFPTLQAPDLELHNYKGLFRKHYSQGWKLFDFRQRNLGTHSPRINRIWALSL